MSDAASGAALALDPAFLNALEEVSSADWSAWFGDLPSSRSGDAPERRMVATFPLPPSRGLAALCLFERRGRDGQTSYHQASLRFTAATVPEGTRVLRQVNATDASATAARPGSLVGAWSDPGLSGWLREALSAGASIRYGGWEWLAAPERPSVSNTTNGSARQIPGRRHDVVLFEPGAVAVVYSGLTRGGQPELDLLRHLERVPGVRVAPTLLGSAIIRSPEGQRTASAALEDLVAGAATVRSVIVGRLHRALDGDPSLQASALDDVRAVGVIARELHGALGRPLEEGVVAGAEPATVADVESWVARAWTALAAATVVLRAATGSDASLNHALEVLPAKLQQFAAAAEIAPGLVHRIHGNLRLDTVLMAPPRRLSVVEFDGDAFLPESERSAPQSPWRDVARLLVSLAEAAAEAAGLAGGDEKAFEIAWLWEREARKACLEGYGSGGGALHALLAIGELEFASRHLLDAVARNSSTVVADHILKRLTRTIV